MGLYDFSYKVGDEREVARAQAHDLDASYKDLSNVFHAIKGLMIPQAKRVLEECISMKKAIPYYRFAKNLGHRSELGGKRGRYPKKEAKIALTLLKSAESNANFKGLEVQKLIVRQAAAYKQNTMRRYRQHFGSSITLGYGKQAIWASYETCRAEVVLAPAGAKDLERFLKAEKKKEEKGKKGSRGGKEAQAGHGAAAAREHAKPEGKK